jgi:hypothetical protein
MTEAEWLTDGGRLLRDIEEFASTRQMLLIAAAFVRRVQPSPETLEAASYDEEFPKCCDDLIEAAADSPRPWAELEEDLYRRRGNWRFTHLLHRNGRVEVARELRKIVAFTPAVPDNYGIMLVHEVVGNPCQPSTFDPASRTPTVLTLAQAAWDERILPALTLDPCRLAVLSDALEDAGCTDDAILDHLRSPGPHVRGCWALDLLLGKE